MLKKQHNDKKMIVLKENLLKKRYFCEKLRNKVICGKYLSQFYYQ